MSFKVIVDPPFRSPKVGRRKLIPVLTVAGGAGLEFEFRPFMSHPDQAVWVHAETGSLITYPRDLRLEDVQGARIFCGSADCYEDVRGRRTDRPRLVGVVAILDLPEPIAFLAQLPKLAGTTKAVHLATKLRADAGVSITELPAEVRCFRCGSIGRVHGFQSVD